MQPSVDRFEMLPVDDIVVDRFQVRTTNTSEGIDELAESIKKYGLLHPIIVCKSERDEDMWEVVCGQRRLLAHRKLGRSKIQAGVVDRVLTVEEGEAVSANENVHQLSMSRPDLIDLCERLYLRYGTIQAVADKTKIPYHVVRKYVRFARLEDEIKEKVKNHEVQTDLAVKAQDASTYNGEVDVDEALALIEELKRSDNDLRKRMLDVKKKNPGMDLDDVKKEAEKPPEDVSIRFKLFGEMADGIRELASEKGTDTSTVASDLVEEALVAQGIVEGEE